MTELAPYCFMIIYFLCVEFSFCDVLIVHKSFFFSGHFCLQVTYPKCEIKSLIIQFIMKGLKTCNGEDSITNANGQFCVTELFDNYMQQDAHEFLNYLLNTVADLLQGKYIHCNSMLVLLTLVVTIFFG